MPDLRMSTYDAEIGLLAEAMFAEATLREFRPLSSTQMAGLHDAGGAFMSELRQLSAETATCAGDVPSTYGLLRGSRNKLTMAEADMHNMANPLDFCAALSPTRIAEAEERQHEMSAELWNGLEMRQCHYTVRRQQADNLALPSDVSPPLPLKLLSVGFNSIVSQGHSNTAQGEYTPSSGLSQTQSEPQEDHARELGSVLAITMGVFPFASLRQHLWNLKSMDAQRILVVRKIHRLGMDSAQLLHSHFSRYGEVSHVLVPPLKMKPSKRLRNPRAGRLYPSPIGFMVMRDSQDVEAIIAESAAQMVNTGSGAYCIPIEIRLFESRNFTLCADDDEDECGVNGQLQANWVILTL
jgi:hypothetical protein